MQFLSNGAIAIADDGAAHGRIVIHQKERGGAHGGSHGQAAAFQVGSS